MLAHWSSQARRLLQARGFPCREREEREGGRECREAGSRDRSELLDRSREVREGREEKDAPGQSTCTGLHCTALYCTLYSTVLHCSALYCTLYCTAPE